MDYLKNSDKIIDNSVSIIAFTSDRVYKQLYYNTDIKKLFESYNLAVDFGLIIHESNDNYILTSTPRYKCSLLDHLNKIKHNIPLDEFKMILIEYIHKIKLLICKLHESTGIWHLEIYI